MLRSSFCPQPVRDNVPNPVAPKNDTGGKGHTASANDEQDDLADALDLFHLLDGWGDCLGIGLYGGLQFLHGLACLSGHFGAHTDVELHRGDVRHGRVDLVVQFAAALVALDPLLLKDLVAALAIAAEAGNA